MTRTRAGVRRELDPAAVARLQGAVFVVSGVWPLLSMRTFEAITGPKHDRWLVRTVGLLAAAIGTDLLVGARRGRAAERRLIGVGSALSFAAIDVWYVTRGRISRVYLLDAAMELAFAAAWAATGERRPPADAPDQVQAP